MRNLTFIWLTAIVIISNTIGQVLLKMAANTIKAETNIKNIIETLICSPVMWLALVFYGITMAVWVLVLRVTPLSVAYTAMALVFITVPLTGIILFNEPISMRFLSGLILIVFGVWLTCFG